MTDPRNALLEAVNEHLQAHDKIARDAQFTRCGCFSCDSFRAAIASREQESPADERDGAVAPKGRVATPLPAPSEWRGMESAPKDGTAIIVAVHTNLYGWVLGHSRWDGARGIYGWVSGGFNDPPGTLGLAHPTHWQPLPAPPGKEKEVPDMDAIARAALSSPQKTRPAREFLAEIRERASHADLVKALEEIEDYWNGTYTEAAMSDALNAILAIARSALRSHRGEKE